MAMMMAMAGLIDSDPRAPGRQVPEYLSAAEDGDMVDLASENSFPASDPPTYGPHPAAGDVVDLAGEDSFPASDPSAYGG
jgi:hypothetical protein